MSEHSEKEEIEKAEADQSPNSDDKTVEDPSKVEAVPGKPEPKADEEEVDGERTPKSESKENSEAEGSATPVQDESDGEKAAADDDEKEEAEKDKEDVKEEQADDVSEKSGDEVEILVNSPVLQSYSIHGFPVIHRGVRGFVRWFSLKKGYGFLSRNDTGGDIFVHLTGIVEREKWRQDLESGQQVEFHVVKGPKGLQASNVTLVGGKSAPPRPPFKGRGAFRPPLLPFFPKPFRQRPFSDQHDDTFKNAQKVMEAEDREPEQGGPAPLAARHPERNPRPRPPPVPPRKPAPQFRREPAFFRGTVRGGRSSKPFPVRIRVVDLSRPNAWNNRGGPRLDGGGDRFPIPRGISSQWRRGGRWRRQPGLTPVGFERQFKPFGKRLTLEE